MDPSNVRMEGWLVPSTFNAHGKVHGAPWDGGRRDHLAGASSPTLTSPTLTSPVPVA